MAKGSHLHGSYLAKGLIAFLYREDHIFYGGMKIVMCPNRGLYDFPQEVDKEKRSGQYRRIANSLLGFALLAVAVVLAVILGPQLFIVMAQCYNEIGQTKRHGNEA